MLGGALGLSDALKINESLTSIDLSYNRIGTEGAESLADAFAQNPSLTELNLRRNKIGDAGASALASTLGRVVARSLRTMLKLTFDLLQEMTQPRNSRSWMLVEIESGMQGL